MKKTLLALTLLATFTGLASAQSSVKLFGTLDLNGRFVKNDGTDRRLSLSQDGLNPSQLGIKAVEDLGGGLKAAIELLAGINGDTGTSNVTTTSTNATNTATTSKFWNRRSVISLFSPLGELRLGRDYKPEFYNNAIFDAFGILGVGSSINVAQRYGGTRQDNAINYILPPDIGGVYGQLMVSASEGATSDDRPGRYIGGRLGFAKGPFNIAVVVGDQRYDRPFAGNLGGDTQRTYNLAGSWNFGVVKLLGIYDREQLERGVRENRGSISAVVPIGVGEVHVGYTRSKLDTNGPDFTADQIALGYVYNLSKRTAMYGTASYLSNKDASARFIPGGNTVGAQTNGKSKGFELGVRHFF